MKAISRKEFYDILDIGVSTDQRSYLCDTLLTTEGCRDSMDLRAVLLGDRWARRRVTVLAVVVPTVASIAFVLGYDLVLGFSVVYIVLGIALYAGWIHAGIIAGLGTVFFSILWRFVFPPLVGYLRWSMDTRYTPPRQLDYKRYPVGELLEGLTRGPIYALFGAVVVGGLAYASGVLLRRVSQR